MFCLTFLPRFGPSLPFRIKCLFCELDKVARIFFSTCIHFKDLGLFLVIFWTNGTKDVTFQVIFHVLNTNGLTVTSEQDNQKEK